MVIAYKGSHGDGSRMCLNLEECKGNTHLGRGLLVQSLLRWKLRLNSSEQKGDTTTKYKLSQKSRRTLGRTCV